MRPRHYCLGKLPDRNPLLSNHFAVALRAVPILASNRVNEQTNHTVPVIDFLVY